MFMKKEKIFFLMIFFICFTALQSITARESYRWDNVKIGGGGFVSAVIADPKEKNLFYARTDVGGAYRWHEATKNWIPLLDWVNTDERGLLGVEAIAVDPVEPGTVYLMAGTVYWNQANDGIGRSAFLRSKDYGKTWQKIYVWDDEIKNFNVHGNGMGRGNGEALAVDPANNNIMFYGSKNKGLWKSTNNGNTWNKVKSFPIEKTWNGCGISFVAFDPSTSGATVTSRLYVGVLEESDNIYVSEDAGQTWQLVPGLPQPTYDGSASMRLMPQRIAIVPDGSAFFITLGNGAGPHPMQWDEGWGPINDWFNRGAVYKYVVASQTWSDISPQNFLNPDSGDYTDPSTFYGCYSGISINPANPDQIVVSSISSYRATQYWMIDGQWKDHWGDNIFVTEDGGQTWIPSFRYYWLDGGQVPDAKQMDENGVPWIIGNTIHWIGSVCMDPFNPKRVFVTSGNGIYMTENIFNYEISTVKKSGQERFNYTQYTVWKFAAQGVEETVPLDLVSIPGGPLVSVIGDYDGFVHTDLQSYPLLGQHTLSVSGSKFHLGTTTGLAYAPASGRLAKTASTRQVKTQHNTIPIGPVQWSDDHGETWTTETYTSNPPADLNGGTVAISNDGAVTLWMPSKGTVMYRNVNTQWTEVAGIDFQGHPVADWENPDLFYVYNKENGSMYISTNGGLSFSKTGFAGTSNVKRARTTPYHEGHIWVPRANDKAAGDGALMLSTDRGQTFTAIPGIDYCEAVGFGKAAPAAAHPTVFAYARVGGLLGIWRSTDYGQSWIRVNDDAHEYGGLANGEFVKGDMNVFGRVYMSTAGRGIVYGDIAGNAIAVTGVTLAPKAVELAVSGTAQLSAVVAPANASNKSVTWKSSDKSIATVSQTGLVTALAPGQAIITVTTNDGSFTDTTEVTVSANKYVVTINTIGPGSVTIDPKQAVYAEGTKITLTAKPAADYSFSGWSGDASGTETTIMLTVNSALTITATFTKNSGEIPISLPFTQDGAGEYSFVTGGNINYINSWGLDLLTINGVDFTNTYVSGSMLPERINGKYYLVYKGTHEWSHLEITGSNGQ